MKRVFSLLSCSQVVAILLAASLLIYATTSKAAVTTDESGVRLLQVELPAHVTLLGADGEQLAAAVGKATLAHQPQARAILRVALTRGIAKLQRGERVLPCPYVKRIFSVSVAAAPTQASALLDLATELYPDCAAELAGALRDYDQVAFDYKDRVNDKNVVDDRNSPAHAASTDVSNPSEPTAAQALGDPAAAVQDPGDLSARDISGLGFGDSTGYGSGFPGSPGFVGSPPSGGVALPPSPITSVVNG